MIVQDGAPDSRVQEFTLRMNRFGMRDVLIIVGSGKVHDFAGVTQTNRAQRFHFTHFERDHHFVNVRERAAFALGSGLAFGQ